jgi:hypothetical protein
MKNKVMKTLLMVMILVGLKILLFPAQSTKASPQEPFAACVTSVPHEWGEFVGSSPQSGVAFRDRHGTIRFVTNFPCNGATPTIALEVRRTPVK